MFPVLFVAATAAGIFAGGFAGQLLGYLTMNDYIEGARDWFKLFDAIYGATKCTVFGFFITSIACWKGFHTEGGADGVGRSTTQAVVISCVVILVADYIIADILL